MSFTNNVDSGYLPEMVSPDTAVYTSPTNDWMQTFSGKAFFPAGPITQDDISEYDIAHSLSMQCRFNGHTKEFYSVAEHCIIMSYVVPAEDALWALLHDATEAYVGDLIRPIKKHLPEFVVMEDRIMRVIVDKWQLGSYDMPASVKEADNRMIENEREVLLTTSPLAWTVHGDPLPNVVIHAWGPEEAEFRYFNRLQELLAIRGDLNG